jgi:Domain of Unknown Function with PDB structure (DUF3857)/Transglutaminase-like superfamily
MKMRPFLLLLGVLLVTLSESGAQVKPEYAASNIPDSIKKMAKAVQRFHRAYVQIESPGKAVYSLDQAVTVLDAKNSDLLNVAIGYNKFLKVENVEVTLYDAVGNFIKKYRQKDMKDRAAFDGYSLLSDSRYLYSDVSNIQLPATAEISYTLRFKGVYALPGMFVQQPGSFIQQSSLEVKTKKAHDIRYKSYGCTIGPHIIDIGDVKEYKWEVTNQPPFGGESGTASVADLLPQVKIAPTRFEMDDQPGDMSSWEMLGKWHWELNQGTDNFKEEQKNYFRSLVKDATTEAEKVRILYRFLQQHYRYVSIQLGIGGMKPFTARFVDEQKYGDCKALSNYMYAMLQAVNINSHYAIINAGYDELPVDPDFPGSGFNHVILCVPQEKDSIWLECTSNMAEPGKLGSFTENRYALLVKEQGSVLVATPASKAGDNQLHIFSIIKLNEEGAGEVKTQIKTTGGFRSQFMSNLAQEREDVQKEFFINNLGFKAPETLLVDKSTGEAEFRVNLSMTYEKVPDMSPGTKQFLPPRLYPIWRENLPDEGRRKQDYFLQQPFTCTDTTIYVLPTGYIVESLPKANSIAFKHGTYSSKYSFDATTERIISVCHYTLTTNRIPAADYAKARFFIDQVQKEEKEHLIIRKK